jgi:hypothetical protein
MLMNTPTSTLLVALALGYMVCILARKEEKALKHIHEIHAALEKQLSYKVIPIRSLVRVQLGSALATAEYIGKKRK